MRAHFRKSGRCGHAAGLDSPTMNDARGVFAAVDTPALLLDLDQVERNIRRYQRAADGAGLTLRPHAKAHKCPQVGKLQLEAGAAGLCCAKLAEAEALAAARARRLSRHDAGRRGGEARAVDRARAQGKGHRRRRQRREHRRARQSLRAGGIDARCAGGCGCRPGPHRSRARRGRRRVGEAHQGIPEPAFSRSAGLSGKAAGRRCAG